MSTLSDAHLAEVRASAISTEVIAARGYETVTNPRGLPDAFAGSQKKMHGLLIPIRDVTGIIATYQLKPDNPRTDPATGKPIKYETAANGRTCLDVPASVLPMLRDTDTPLWITEGCKKVDAGLSNHVPSIIGVQGVWNWKSQGMALSDWDEIALRGREVVIAFDSDVMVKVTVRGALEALARYLTMQRAEVRYLVMPDLPDGEKCGLDDWFVSDGSRLELDSLITDTLPDSVMDWQEPIPLEPTTGPPFPLEALPDTEETPLRSLATAIADQTQAPVDIGAWCALAVIGAAVRGRLDVQARKNWREPVHIQSLQVLVSGGGKGPTYRELTAPLYRWDADQRALWEAEHATWERERKLREVNEKKYRNKATAAKATSDDERRWQGYMQALMEWEQQEPWLRRIVASNTTAEALEKRIYEQGGAMAVVSGEGSFLANITGAYSDQPKLGVLLHGYTGEPFENDRKTDNEQWRVSRSCVAVSLAIQPRVLIAMGQVPGFQDLGAAARFLVTCPKEIAWPELDPPDIPDHLTNWWNRRILEIANDTEGSAAEPVAITLADDAREVFHGERQWWREATAAGVFANMPEWGRKYAGMVLRIAGLLHVVQEASPHTTPISTDTIARAVTIMRHAIEHARIGHGLMNGTEAHGRASDILEVVKRLQAESGSVTSADVYDRVRGRQAFQRTATVIGALRTLEERRHVRLERREGPGPETYFVILNPLDMPAEMRSSPISDPVGVISHLRSHSGDAPDRETDLDPTGTDGATWEDF